MRRGDNRWPCECKKEQLLALDVHSSRDEPPGADPHARWCGAGGEKTPATRLAGAIELSAAVFLFPTFLSPFSRSSPADFA